MADFRRYHDAARGPGADESRPEPVEAEVELPVARLVALWNAAWPADGRLRSGVLRAAAHELAHAAHAAGMRPEQFIATLKDSWRADPRVRGAADQTDVRERLAAVVTLCIQEYYAE